MYENLKGKKLLLLGSDSSDAEIVRTAHSLGVYVICADGKEKSIYTVAKNIADEAWFVDYSKTEEVAKMAIAAGVDGVFAGYSEFRVFAAEKIARAMGKPFYATEESLKITSDKFLFKEMCRKYGVDVPNYILLGNVPTGKALDDINLTFPVIVKPVDGAGRKGIGTCKSKDELPAAVENALSHSVIKKIIVEEYIGGSEFSAVYIIKDGEVSLALLKDKYLQADKRGGYNRHFNLYPSNNLDLFMKTANENMKSLMRDGVGARYGAVMIQGKFCDGKFYAFEANFRLGSGDDHYNIEKEHGLNHVKMMISYSLTGDMQDDIGKNSPYFSEYYGSLSPCLRAGTIGEMKCPDVGDIPEIVKVIPYKAAGMTVSEEMTTAQVCWNIFFVADTKEKMKNAVNYVQDNLSVTDTDGKSMLFEKFDTNTLN